MKIRYTPLGKQRLRIVDNWWCENRPDAPDLFIEEVEEALELLKSNPKLGRFYRVIDGMEIKEYLLERSKQWLYFSADEEQGLIIVHTVWGTQRGSPPQIG